MALHLHPSKMVTNSIQDRTAEFRAVLAQAQKRLSANKLGAQRQSLLSDSQRRAANGTPNGDARGGKRAARSEFARNAAQIGRGITGTMEKLERLAQRMRCLNSATFLRWHKLDADSVRELQWRGGKRSLTTGRSRLQSSPMS